MLGNLRQAINARMKQFDGQGTVRSAAVPQCRSAAPGTTFTLTDHPEHDLDAPEQRKFLITANLYNTATTRHNALAQADRNRSSPSGWYELLRFGRNLGRGPNAADKDPLPANAAHWRQITVPNGQTIWVDLNAEGSYKFSDADFLPIQGWRFINDDTTPNDQRCDSNALKNLIADPDPNATGRLERANLVRRLGNTEVMSKLRRVVCQFPSEWDQATVAARYGFVWELAPFQVAPEAWVPFEAHLRAVSFANLPADYTAATWRFHPRMFIEMMRNCGWLSRAELMQLVPSHSVRSGSYRNAQGQRHDGTFWESNPHPRLLDTHRLPINRTLRKFGINTPLRQAGYFGNSVQETTWWTVLAEGGGSAYWYAPWYGRGFLQLTHPDNYIGYWRWRGRTVPEALESALLSAKATADRARSNKCLQDDHFPGLSAEMRGWRSAVEGTATARELIKENGISSSDSAGFYWLKTSMVRYADEPSMLGLERQIVATVDSTGRSFGNKIFYRSLGFWRISAAVNLPGRIERTDYTGLNGFNSRCCAFGVALAILTERLLPDAQGQLTVAFPEGYTRSTP